MFLRVVVPVAGGGLRGVSYRGLCGGRPAMSRAAARRMLLQDGGGKKKRQWHETKVLANPHSLVEREAQVPKSTARTRVLNKVYLDNITDILSTGEVAAQLAGLGLELSGVRVLPNLQGINVYWISTGTEVDDQIEAVLQRNARAIRYELTQLRIVGCVPVITFVKDERHRKLQEVERLLGMADYGDDFEPSDPTHHLRTPSTLTLTTPLDPKLRVAIGDLEARGGEEEKEKDLFEEALKLAMEVSQEDSVDLPADIPTMRDDVLGVNTQQIYRLIQQSLIRARADHRKLGRKPEWGPAGNSFEEMPNPSTKKREIQQWASHYKLLHKKGSRKKDREAALLTLPPHSHTDSMEDLEHREEEDYIEEFDTYEKESENC